MRPPFDAFQRTPRNSKGFINALPNSPSISTAILFSSRLIAALNAGGCFRLHGIPEPGQRAFKNQGGSFRVRTAKVSRVRAISVLSMCLLACFGAQKLRGQA